MSISNRYLLTLMANLLRAGLNFIVSIALARYLMPEQYGSYQYLVSILTAILLFANMGTEKAYFTFISEGMKPWKFHAGYYLWQLLQLTVLMSIIYFLNENWLNSIFHELESSLILVGLIALFMASSVQTTVIHLFESVRKTAYAQILSVGIAMFHLILMVYFIVIGMLDIKLIFQIMIVEYGIYLSAVILLIRYKRIKLYSNTAFDVWHTLNAFYSYSKPLFLYALIAFVYTFFDRWLIQTYVGPEGQAFYSISIQFSTLSILVTSSILNIFWKEIAEAIKQENREKVKEYYIAISDNIFIFTTMVSMVLFFFSHEIITFFYGEVYMGALLVFKLIMLYTITQSLAQLYVTYYMATSQTALYTKISYFFIFVSFPISFYLLSDYGLNMDETGIALKMLVLNIITVLVLEYYIAKHLQIKMRILKKAFIIAGFFLVTHCIHSCAGYLSNELAMQAFLVIFLYILPIMVYLVKNIKKEF